MTSFVHPILLSPQTPDGWDLGDLCVQLQYEMRQEYLRTSQDKRPVVRRIMRNALQIVGLLEQAEAIARDSTDILEQLGEHDPLTALLRPVKPDPTALEAPDV